MVHVSLPALFRKLAAPHYPLAEFVPAKYKVRFERPGRLSAVDDEDAASLQGAAENMANVLMVAVRAFGNDYLVFALPRASDACDDQLRHATRVLTLSHMAATVHRCQHLENHLDAY